MKERKKETNKQTKNIELVIQIDRIAWLLLVSKFVKYITGINILTASMDKVVCNNKFNLFLEITEDLYNSFFYHVINKTDKFVCRFCVILYYVHVGL